MTTAILCVWAMQMEMSVCELSVFSSVCPVSARKAISEFFFNYITTKEVAPETLSCIISAKEAAPSSHKLATEADLSSLISAPTADLMISVYVLYVLPGRPSLQMSVSQPAL